MKGSAGPAGPAGPDHEDEDDGGPEPWAPSWRFTLAWVLVAAGFLAWRWSVPAPAGEPPAPPAIAGPRDTAPPAAVYSVPAASGDAVVGLEPRLDPVVVMPPRRQTPLSELRVPAHPARRLRELKLTRRADVGESVEVQITSYCLRGRTRLGNEVQEGFIAADPRVFPLTRRVELFVDGRSLGEFRVDDTGGVVRGNIIDVWTPSCVDARRFGRRRGRAVLQPRGRRGPLTGTLPR